MKRVIFGMMSIVSILLISACSEGADPQFRIKNEWSDKANVQIQTSGGNTVNINDVMTGETTPYQSAAEGTIVVTAVIQNESVSPKVTFFADKDSRSTVVLVLGEIPTFRIDQ